MIYAAWFDLHNDDVVVDHPTAMRVYARLLRNPLIFMQPQDVKAWVLAKEMGVKEHSVGAALRLLIERGYVLEHERGLNRVRRVTLAIERPEGAPAIGPVPERHTNSAA